jgi:hypothetical protein
MQKNLWNVLFSLLCVLLTAPLFAFEKIAEDTTQKFPTVQVGGFLQFQGKMVQDRPTNPSQDNNRKWGKQLQLWRARIMLGGALSERTSFFMQTEILQPIGFVDNRGNKSIQISPILLDAQMEYALSKDKNFMLYAGMQYVGISRQGLQSPVTLMGQDFGFFQFPYNLFANQPLQNNFGRDLGLNVRGYLLKDRLEFRAGVFRGRGRDVYAPLRSTFRLNYNFLDLEKEHYYSGTFLGKKKVFALGAGFDTQEHYSALAIDAFLELPDSQENAFTLQLSYTNMTGGNSNKTNSFSALIPAQNILFGEIGYYFSKAKLQLVAKYEAQNMNISANQYLINVDRIGILPTVPANLSGFNTLFSNARFAAGVNYYLDGFNSHIKLQYEQVSYGRIGANGQAETKSGGEVNLQFTYFIFK